MKFFLAGTKVVLFAIVLSFSARVQADLVISSWSQDAPPATDNFGMQIEWNNGDDAFMSVRNTSNASVPAIKRLVLGSGFGGSWGFDKLAYVSNLPTTILSPDNVDRGMFGDLELDWTGMSTGLASIISFDIDPDASTDQTMNIGNEFANTFIRVELVDGSFDQLQFSNAGAFTNGVANISGNFTAVPEPSSFGLLLIAAMGLAARRRRYH